MIMFLDIAPTVTLSQTTQGILIAIYYFVINFYIAVYATSYG